jgi:lipopolysaccharide/colanic/teichoic acid biosynthesis glycosyltransferase
MSRMSGVAVFVPASSSRNDVNLSYLVNLPREAALVSAIRRARDLAGSLLLLILTLPIFIVVACLVKLDSPGPILYRQARVGLYGRTFTLLKFRSMRVDAEAGGPQWATVGDSRVTRVGAFLRACRIDELPQLLNVLLGDMSLVGPRPERPHFVRQLARVLPHYNERACVLPGITGWAQVKLPYGASVEDARAKLEYDLFYLANRSLLFDLLILVATVRVVVFCIGSR